MMITADGSYGCGNGVVAALAMHWDREGQLIKVESLVLGYHALRRTGMLTSNGSIMAGI